MYLQRNMRLNTIFGEAIQHRGETVTEGASSNVYAIKDGAIYTHPVNNYILNGITRKVIKWISEDEDIPFKEETFTVEFLKMLMKSLFLVHLLK